MATVVMLGRLRDVAGWRERTVDADSIAGLLGALSDEDGALGEALRGRGVQVALNKAIVRGDQPIAANDEIAFLPPMSGG
jgi:sulfur-carrier protein